MDQYRRLGQTLGGHGINPFVLGPIPQAEIPNVTRGLVELGYSDQDILNILGGNFLRVFRQVCG